MPCSHFMQLEWNDGNACLPTVLHNLHNLHFTSSLALHNIANIVLLSIGTNSGSVTNRNRLRVYPFTTSDQTLKKLCWASCLYRVSDLMLYLVHNVWDVTIWMWSAVCSAPLYFQFSEETRSHFFCMDEWNSSTAICRQLNLTQAVWCKPGTGHGYQYMKPACNFTLLCVPFVICLLKSTNA